MVTACGCALVQRLWMHRAGAAVIAVLGGMLALIAPARAQSWMINEDYLQQDPGGRNATDLDILFEGAVAGRITGGGQGPITNAFPNPTRTVGGDGLGNTIVRFAGSGAGDTISPSAATKRHFGIFGTGDKPRILQKAWSYATAPTRVRVAALDVNFQYDAGTAVATLTATNIGSEALAISQAGYFLSLSQRPLEELNSTFLPPSAFLPLGIGGTLLPSSSVSVTIPGFTPSLSLLTYATADFLLTPTSPDVSPGASGNWAQFTIPAPGAGGVLLGLLGVAGARRRRARCAAAVAGAALITGAATADQVFVLPLVRGLGANEMPYFDVTYQVGMPPMPQRVRVGIDTGNQLVVDGGYAVNSGAANDVAGRLGLMGGVAGGGVNGAGGVGANQENVPMPAGGATFSDPPATPPGQAAMNPGLPPTANTLELPAGMDALVGSQWLSPYNYGRFGDHFILAAKKTAPGGGPNPLGTAQNFQRGTAIANFLSGAPLTLRADGRPVGTATQGATALATNTPTGASFDGGVATSMSVSDPIGGGVLAGNFLIKSGSNMTLISESTAAALGISPGSLTSGQVTVNFGTFNIQKAMLTLNLFNDPLSTFTMPVGILPNALNPLNLNYIGGDLLGKFYYWDVYEGDNGLTFSALVPAPGSACLLVIGGLVAARRKRLG